MVADEPLDPASDDDVVQSFLDSRWRAAIADARSSMEMLRELVPDMATHLPETGYSYLSAALKDAEALYKELHRAGPFIVGTDEYDRFLTAQTARRTG